jgi:hypothetical protein
MELKRRAANDSVTFWLIPAEPEKDLFRELIETLARELKAPAFPAHLTLFTARISSPKRAALWQTFRTRRCRSRSLEWITPLNLRRRYLSGFARASS